MVWYSIVGLLANVHMSSQTSFADQRAVFTMIQRAGRYSKVPITRVLAKRVEHQESGCFSSSLRADRHWTHVRLSDPCGLCFAKAHTQMCILPL